MGIEVRPGHINGVSLLWLHDQANAARACQIGCGVDVKRWEIIVGARDLIAKTGIHISPRSRLPSHTWLGLRDRAIGTIIDVGANDGRFARHARDYFPKARIISFEPVPGEAAKVQAWAARDGNAECHAVALGAADGEAELNLHLDHSESSSLLPVTEFHLAALPGNARQQRITVPVRRLDAMLAERGVALAGEIILKLDTQGFEIEVMRGAPLLLAQARACIAEVSLDPYYQGQPGFADVLDLCVAAGLPFAGVMQQAFAANGRVTFLDAAFIRR